MKISAQKTITCQVQIVNSVKECYIASVTIEQNESVVFQVEPSDTDVNEIKVFGFYFSSIYSIPPEIFTKFVNIKKFYASGENIHEIQPETFDNARNLEELYLYNNNLSTLPADVFNGEFLKFHKLDNKNFQLKV